jgi:hypothetical protein
MRRLASIVILTAWSAAAGSARAADTAAVLVAMPDQAAEQRYLAQLCMEATEAERQYFEALDAQGAAARNGRDFDDAVARKQDAAAFHAQRIAAYGDAAAAYHAKRDGAPPPCEAVGKAAVDRLIAKLTATTMTMQRTGRGGNRPAGK